MNTCFPAVLDGIIHAPFYIFIRHAATYSDADLLRLLDRTEYEPVHERPVDHRHVCITQDEEWTQIMDDWYYTLWRNPATHELITDFGRVHDVFTCSVGGSDASFDFAYYHGGALARRMVVEDPFFDNGIMTINRGIPLPGEARAMKESDEWRLVLTLAESLGINLRHDLHHLRVYAPPRV